MDSSDYRDERCALAGNTRVRWSGRGGRGVMGIGCINPFGTLWGLLNVTGVEEGAVCESGQTQTIICNLEKKLRRHQAVYDAGNYRVHHENDYVQRHLRNTDASLFE